jgi:hypothetical protein
MTEIPSKVISNSKFLFESVFDFFSDILFVFDRKADTVAFNIRSVLVSQAVFFKKNIVFKLNSFLDDSILSLLFLR